MHGEVILLTEGNEDCDSEYSAQSCTDECAIRDFLAEHVKKKEECMPKDKLYMQRDWFKAGLQPLFRHHSQGRCKQQQFMAAISAANEEATTFSAPFWVPEGELLRHTTKFYGQFTIFSF